MNNCICSSQFRTVVLEKTLESPLGSKEIKPVNPKGNQPWIFIGRTDAEAEAPFTLATWSEAPSHWERPWTWERWKVIGEGDDRRRDDWMASQTQWTWVWASSGRWWRTGRPVMLQSVGSQRIRHYWVTEQTNMLIKPTVNLTHWCDSDIFWHCLSLGLEWKLTFSNSCSTVNFVDPAPWIMQSSPFKTCLCQILKQGPSFCSTESWTQSSLLCQLQILLTAMGFLNAFFFLFETLLQCYY